MGCLALFLIALIIIALVVCGAVVELFWPIVVVIAAYYLIKWLNGDSSPDKKSGDK